MTVDTTPHFVTRACKEDEHELVETDGKRYCRVCKFSEESLRDVIGHEV